MSSHNEPDDRLFVDATSVLTWARRGTNPGRAAHEYVESGEAHRSVCRAPWGVSTPCWRTVKSMRVFASEFHRQGRPHDRERTHNGPAAPAHAAEPPRYGDHGRLCVLARRAGRHHQRRPVDRFVFTGDFAAADGASTKAAKFSKIAFGVAIGLFVLYVVVYAIIIAAIISHNGASPFAG